MNAPIIKTRLPGQSPMSLRQRATHCLGSLALVMAISACSDDSVPATNDVTRIGVDVVSSQPHLVTGGSALIDVQHDGSASTQPMLQLNDRHIPLPADARVSDDEDGVSVRFLLTGQFPGHRPGNLRPPPAALSVPECTG